MGTGFDQAVSQFITSCRYVRSVQDLITKWRLELGSVYVLDLYFNSDLSKNSYTLISQGVRILGWDNARHYPGLANFPHHLHRPDGRIVPSDLTGDPEHDLQLVQQEIEAYLDRR
jgi:hypothetical protein